MPPKDADEMANSVVSDQKQSGLVLHFVAQNCLFQYRIYSAVRRGFHLSRMSTNNLISSM